MMQPKRKARPQSVDEILLKQSSSEEKRENSQSEQHTEAKVVGFIPADDEETILAGKEIRRFGKNSGLRKQT
jgi:hypothetical protein